MSPYIDKQIQNVEVFLGTVKTDYPKTDKIKVGKFRKQGKDRAMLYICGLINIDNVRLPNTNTSPNAPLNTRFILANMGIPPYCPPHRYKFIIFSFVFPATEL